MPPPMIAAVAAINKKRNSLKGKAETKGGAKSKKTSSVPLPASADSFDLALDDAQFGAMSGDLDEIAGLDFDLGLG